ncbi:hypothetical protein [Helicobacter bilis]|uniref:hypothetical protein n=1 Tax=Helicobacter bilis TaxID=37372 RepID=UPI00131527E2|nr:hypothetical protein [Helicobacter bilis]
MGKWGGGKIKSNKAKHLSLKTKNTKILLQKNQCLSKSMPGRNNPYKIDPKKLNLSGP